jgi:Cu/Ag efflux pump CusA
MAPITSIMGEILLAGMQAAGKTTPMELRTIADWEVRQRLLAVAGVSQVSVIGGELKQYQVLTSPQRLSRHDVTLDQLLAAVEKSNIVTDIFRQADFINAAIANVRQAIRNGVVWVIVILQVRSAAPR